jgi:ribosomal protein S18 acetylase RimI-like enzyme
MKVAEYQMEHVFKCNACSLRVRISNRAAISLYKRVL